MQSETESSPSKSKLELFRQKFDVVVSGNDPAGYYCSWSAAKEGLKVLHLDSRSPVSLCPEWSVSQLTEQMFTAVKGKGFPNLLIQKTQGLCYHRTFPETKQFKLPGEVYNRSLFDQALAQQAKIAGAQFVQGAIFRKLTPQGLEADFGGKTVNIATRTLVSADGVRSPIRSALGFDQDDFLAALQYRVQLTEEHRNVHFFGDSQMENGLGWFIPRDKSANVGFGVIKRVAHVLMFKLHQLLDHLIAQGWIEADELTYKSGGLIPISGPCIPPGKDGIFFVGDAAGLRDTILPGVGVGLGTACLAGILAGQVIAEEIRQKKVPRIDAYLQEMKPILDGRMKLQSSTGFRRLGSFLPLQKS